MTRHYARSGVDTDQIDLALSRLLLEIAPTQAFGAQSEIGVGHFAAVVRAGPLCLALSTDGVGTKVMIAALAGRYDTIGIDCVAMNVNDLICVGARPIAMLDYIAVERPDPEVFAQIGRGLAEGAKLAEVSIVGGETAQIPDMLRGAREGLGLDLAGTAVGIVPEGELCDGSAVEPGDAVIGIASSGVHSNGHSLARRVLLPRFELQDYVGELDCSLAEELLRPTHIYVAQVKALREAGVRPHALAHITGDGLLNLRRVEAPVGFEITDLPEVPAIFAMIQRFGEIDPAEMYAVFNMGIGFAVTVAASDAEKTLRTIRASGICAWQIGHTVPDPERCVRLPRQGLVGRSKRFEPERG